MTEGNNVVLTKEQELEAEIARLRAENGKLKAKADAQTTSNSLSLRVSDKGGVAVYGMGRFPLTLYKSQWEKLLAIVPEIQAFIKANEAKLTVKVKEEKKAA